MKRWWPIGFMLILFALLPAMTTLAQDTDGDGLPDVWETQGIRDPVSGQVLVDLPAMGANPMHKDLFVEVDYMVGAGHSHKPKHEALRQVINAFANAPVMNNPGDRTPGITIHIDAGSDTVMDPVRGTMWGNLSQSTALPEQQFLLPEGDDNLSGLQSIRNANFNAARAQVFRYCVFGHNLGIDRRPMFLGGSGIASGIPGFNFIVTLGGWTDDVGSVPEQGGTFLHELGHTLGLRHGGDSDIHRKPNYLSIMNYLFQTRGLRVNGADFLLDFSRTRLTDLNEQALNENAGIAPPSAYGTRWENEDNTMSFFSNNTSPIDWNQNGVPDPLYARDINFDGSQTVLTGYDDWSNIKFVPIGTGTTAAAQLVQAEQVLQPAASEEITKAEDDQIPTEFEVSVDIEDELRSAFPGNAVQYMVDITNLGTQADTYNITTRSSLGWANFAGLPSQVTLNPQEVQRFTFTVAVPENTPIGQTEESMLLVSSVHSPLLEDEAEALTEAAAAGGCAGDCNGDGAVTIDELVTMVNVALGEAFVDDCLAGDVNGDGDITINEVLKAVNNAINECTPAT